MHGRRLLASLVTVVLSTAAGAQERSDAPRLELASRVRLLISVETLPSGGHRTVEGTLVGGDSTKLVVLQPGHAEGDTVPTYAIDRFQVYAGRYPRSKLVIGGAAAGAGISLALHFMDNHTRSSSLVPGYAYAAPVVLGALVGCAFPASHWEDVPRRAIAVGLAPGSRLQVSSSIRFR